MGNTFYVLGESMKTQGGGMLFKNLAFYTNFEEARRWAKITLKTYKEKSFRPIMNICNKNGRILWEA